MNIKQLKLFNFWSHKDTTINFDEPFYMILGKIQGSEKSNGSGKSTIARGIAYALYGDASDEIKKNDDAIYNDAEKMGVLLTFELNGIDYTIKRKLVRGSSPQIFIQKGDTEEIKFGVKQGQHMINTILGADFSIFKNTSYFKQGDISSFSTLTPKEAKEVVIKILQLDNYNGYETIAKEKTNSLSVTALQLKIEVDNLDNQINALAGSVKSISGKEFMELKEYLEELKQGKAEASAMIKLRDEGLSKVADKYGKIVALSNVTTFEITALQSRINKISGLNGTCPTCEHVLNENTKQGIITSLTEALKPHQEKSNIYREELEKVENERKEIDNESIDKYNYDQAITVTSQKIGEAKTQLKQAEEQHEKIATLKATQLDKSTQQQLLEKERDIYTNLQQAFGKKGIQAYIIDNVIPEIQATTNDVLEGLDTDIRINIESQKELKKGGKAETLDISVLTEFGERPYTNYSGGEKTFIDFALRIALSIILTRRSKCKIQTLILDEVFGELDSINKRIISKALRFIANKYDFKKILIISHAEELQDSFENVIRVEFDGESSHIVKEKEYAN